MRRLLALALGLAFVGLSSSDPAWAQKKTINDLLKDIDSKTQATRISALKEVGELADIKLSHAQKAMPQINAILEKDPDAKVRAAALAALGKIEAENDKYIPNMLKYLKEDKDYGVQGTALGLLALYQQEAAAAIKPLKERLEELRDANKDKDPGDIRSGILNTLGQINQNLRQPLAIEAVKDDKALSVKLNAINTLTQIGQQGGAKEAAPVLIEVYGESLKAGPSPELRRAILGALSFIQPDPKDYSALLLDTLKKDKDPGLASAVIAALGRGGETPKEAIPLALDVAKAALSGAPKDGGDPNGQRRGLVDGLGKMKIEPKEVVPVLVDYLNKDRDLGVRSTALVALGGHGKTKEAVTAVTATAKANTKVGAKDGNDPGDFRKLTVDTLARMELEPKEVVPLLTDSVKFDKNYAVRMAAVKHLGEIGPPAKSAEAALKALQKLPKNAGEQEKTLAAAAGEALDKIKAK